MWLTGGVVILVAVFLWREIQAWRRGTLPLRQLRLRFVLSGLLVALGLLLQFGSSVLVGIENAPREVQLLRLSQFLIAVVILVAALLLTVLLDLRETIRHYATQRKQMIERLVHPPNDSNHAPPA